MALRFCCSSRLMAHTESNVAARIHESPPDIIIESKPDTSWHTEFLCAISKKLLDNGSETWSSYVTRVSGWCTILGFGTTFCAGHFAVSPNCHGNIQLKYVIHVAVGRHLYIRC